ncbi:hypothetical protein QAD02_005925 [Eretmocerus hayati]|uniref:Uncharacterized protein n=1 Tax=Eretmocerus hayati TaxID=131215 RepID=A0ACC2N0J7_9HYME|nr:hypothetical protein QAD02_005925 [Eretmocerus hayati]
MGQTLVQVEVWEAALWQQPLEAVVFPLPQLQLQAVLLAISLPTLVSAQNLHQNVLPELQPQPFNQTKIENKTTITTAKTIPEDDSARIMNLQDSETNYTVLSRTSNDEWVVSANNSTEPGSSKIIKFSNRTIDRLTTHNKSSIRYAEVDKESTGISSNPSGVKSKQDDDTEFEPRVEDLVEAADFGVQAMEDLYTVKEPELYSMGLYLSSDNPARYVAAFNHLSDEAKQLTRFGFAALEATRRFRTKHPNFVRQASLNIHNAKVFLREECPRRGVPQCPGASMRYRTADGTCNNRRKLWWGSAMSTMQRFLPPVYDDGIDRLRKSVTGEPLPSARTVSDWVHQERDLPLPSVTHMLMQWGQFIDHDITATGQSQAFMSSVPQCCLRGGVDIQPPEFLHPDCEPITVEPSDSRLGNLGVRCMEFVRSAPAPREDCDFGAREQLSQVTSFIDASTVYASNARLSDGLRLFRNGLLQYGKLQSRRPVLPRDDSDLCKRGSLSTSCFRAGDGRLSEQPALVSLHVIFLRLHNRLATQLSALNQHWSDERIFQETRKIVGAIVQHITYREFLPIVLGPDIMKIFDIEPLKRGYYEGYDENIDPNIANAFSTAAYRFGHSLVQRSFVRFDKNHRPLFNNVSIHEEFSHPVNLETAGSVERILLGLVNQPCQRRDEFISDELTSHLFQTPGFEFGMDLAAINIQRGRDHGIAPFVDWRQPCSLGPIRNWDDMARIMDPETARTFQEIYASVEDVDLFSAGLAEKPVTGGLVGPTFACIIAQQFRSLRKGDRFWYENPFAESGFTQTQLRQIRKVTLAQVMCRTTDSLDDIQPFVMLVSDGLRNRRLRCTSPLLQQIDLTPWRERKPPKQDPQNDAAETPSEETVAEEEIVPDANEEDTEMRTSMKKKHQISRGSQRQKPTKTRINQTNRIAIRRPIGPPENLTIVVNNHAVNAPVFVSDSIYGSNVQYNGNPNSESVYRPQQTPQRPINTYGSTPKPKPPQQQQFPSNQFGNPYIPHNFADPSNPNPPMYDMNPKPYNGFLPNNDFFQNNIPSIPSYHSNLEQTGYGASNQSPQYTTKRPNRPTQRPGTYSSSLDYDEEFPEIDPDFGDSHHSSSGNRPLNGNNPPGINADYANYESDFENLQPTHRPRPTKKHKRPASHRPSNRPKKKPQTVNSNEKAADGTQSKPSHAELDKNPVSATTSRTSFENRPRPTTIQYSKTHGERNAQNSYSHGNSSTTPINKFLDKFKPLNQSSQPYASSDQKVEFKQLDETEEIERQLPSKDVQNQTPSSSTSNSNSTSDRPHQVTDSVDSELPRPMDFSQYQNPVRPSNANNVDSAKSGVDSVHDQTDINVSKESDSKITTVIVGHGEGILEKSSGSGNFNDDIPAEGHFPESSVPDEESKIDSALSNLPRPMKLRHGN